VVRNPFRSRRETRRRAREAVDAEKARDVHSEAAEEDVEPNGEASETVRAAAAQETVEVGESTARRARRRGRKTIFPEDVAQANNGTKSTDDADDDRLQRRPRRVLPSD
jgi:histone H3/H4